MRTCDWRATVRATARRLCSTLTLPPQELLVTGTYSLHRDRFGVHAGRLEESKFAAAPLVVIGELHAFPPIVCFEKMVAEAMLASSSCGTLNIVLEHFSFEMQPLLDEYAKGTLPFAELVARYDEIGTEGHDIAAYSSLLALAVHEQRVKLHAGFIPRTFARMVMRESLAVALDAAKAKGYLAADERCTASEGHYNFFESLISGRDMHGPLPPSDRFRAMFPAQVIKDAAMAHKASSEHPHVSRLTSHVSRLTSHVSRLTLTLTCRSSSHALEAIRATGIASPPAAPPSGHPARAQTSWVPSL